MRRLIRKALKDDLATILIANEYENDIKLVHDSVPELDEVTTFPSIAVQSLGERFYNNSENVRTAIASYTIIAYFSTQKGIDLENYTDSLYSDICKAIDNPVNLSELPIEQIEVLEYMPFVLEEKGFIGVLLEIKYIKE